MSYFNFVSDEDLTVCVVKVIDAAKRAVEKADSDFEGNVLDPFAALFSVTYNDLKLDDWNGLERERQSQKSIQNAIGDFHQSLLGKFKGWENSGRGGSFDVSNEEKLIIAEIKNKHNTLNSGGAFEVYAKLADHLKYDKKGFTAYLVQIIPKNGKDYNVKWSPNLKTTALREDIRKIDGESFYDLASGEKDTLSRIFAILPEIIAKELNKKVLGKDTFEECMKLFATVYK
jgi:hypothetical protein